MKLYKNVDIVDLKSIMTKGILSMKESGNYNWESGHRSDNSEEVVYLFKPVENGKRTFIGYGAALLEVEVNAIKNEFDELDTHADDYEEYIVERVAPEKITRVIIPEAFRSMIAPELIEGIDITWCELKMDEYDYFDEVERKSHFKPVTEDFMKMFQNTACVVCTGFSPYREGKDYFRAVDENRRVHDVYNVEYIF